MSATNTTVNYSFPLFIGTDKPAWLVDWNGAMAAIDTAIKNAADAAGSAATDISALSLTVEGLSTTVGSHTTAITGLTTSVNGLTGTVNTITSLIGNGQPTTTDKTLIGAINEINAKVGSADKKTLAANATSISFTVPTTGDNLIDFYCEGGADYTAIDTSVSGTVTLTYAAVSASRQVTMYIREV